mmetsp:Transcript_35681/g.33825  ORF Transcript_35681/g.33825 Transcript_35681/m.33825 type:complete len:368 (+) Transcript_35681:194-1297(+)
MSGHSVKSKFRGVYKCGKRWKAQLQSQGVQFYLGTFDTEHEAAKAYDRKARDEKGQKGQTNFDDNGVEIVNTTYNPEGGQEETSVFISNVDVPDTAHLSAYKAKKARLAAEALEKKFSMESIPVVAPPSSRSYIPPPPLVSRSPSVETVVPSVQISFSDNTIQVRMMWERLCQISQRVLLAKAAIVKISDLHAQEPDMQKEALLKSLNDEVFLLTQVKTHVEEALARSVSEGLSAALTVKPNEIDMSQDTEDSEEEGYDELENNTNYNKKVDFNQNMSSSSSSMGNRNIYMDGAVTNANTSNNSYIRKIDVIGENSIDNKNGDFENGDFENGDFENGNKRRKMDDIGENVHSSSGVHRDLYPICQSL